MTEAHGSSCVSADGAHDTLSPRHAPVTGHMPLLRPLPASAPGHQPPVVTSTRCVVSISLVSPVSPDSGHCHQSLTARHNTRVDTDQYPQCQCSRGTPPAPQAGLSLVPGCPVLSSDWLVVRGRVWSVLSVTTGPAQPGRGQPEAGASTSQHKTGSGRSQGLVTTSSYETFSVVICHIINK